MLRNMTRIRKWQVLTSILFCLIANSLNLHAQTRDVVYATKKDLQGNMGDLKLDVYHPCCMIDLIASFLQVNLNVKNLIKEIQEFYNNKR